MQCIPSIVLCFYNFNAICEVWVRSPDDVQERSSNDSLLYFGISKKYRAKQLLQGANYSSEDFQHLVVPRRVIL